MGDKLRVSIDLQARHGRASDWGCSDDCGGRHVYAKMVSPLLLSGMEQKGVRLRVGIVTNDKIGFVEIAGMTGKRKIRACLTNNEANAY